VGRSVFTKRTEITKQVGKHLIWGFRGQTPPSWLYSVAEEYGLKGVILFDYDFQKKKYDNNISSPTQLKALIAGLKKDFPGALIFIDQEGGKVRRLKPQRGFQDLPSHEEWTTLPKSVRRDFLRKSFGEMRELGIDVNLAPVVDLNDNPENPDIGKIQRSMGVDPRRVFDWASEWFEEANRVGLGLSLKHFPGLGGAKVNSHLELTDLTGAVRPEQIQLFYDLAQAFPGHRCLISHGILPEWHPTLPISFDRASIERCRLQMPHSLLVSDDLQMQGLQKLMPTAEAISKGIEAGVDEIIVGNNLISEEAEPPLDTLRSVQQILSLSSSS
jgi:beta-N-acetylhexosaminidase